jgi:predicted nucleic acid-binding protein
LIVVDTSAWIELLRRTESRAHTTLRQLLREGADIRVTEAVVMEVLAGARSPNDRMRLHRMVLGFPILRLDGLAGFEAAADLFRTCRAAGESLRGLMDCLVAAPAIRAEAELLHADGDFDKLARHTPLRLFPLGP